MVATPEGTAPIPLIPGLPIFGSIFELDFDVRSRLCKRGRPSRLNTTFSMSLATLCAGSNNMAKSIGLRLCVSSSLFVQRSSFAHVCLDKSQVFINSARLAAEVLDERRFHKVGMRPLDAAVCCG